METEHYVAHSMEAVDAIRAEVDTVVRVDAALPGWPFRFDSASTILLEFDLALWPEFGEVLRSLAAQFKDEYILVYVPDPSPTIASFAADGEYFAFRFSVASLPDVYAPLMYPTTTSHQVGIEANRLAICGSSGQWGVWAQRDWELALLASKRHLDLSNSALTHLRSGDLGEYQQGKSGLAARLADIQRAVLLESVAAHSISATI